MNKQLNELQYEYAHKIKYLEDLEVEYKAKHKEVEFLAEAESEALER